MSDDYLADKQTTGTVAVGGSVTGNIETATDEDWFAVELVAGHTYVIDLRGSPTSDGTLSDPYLRGIHDADGNLISGTTNDDGGKGYNSRLTFTASESGTYYIAAGAHGSRQGTYKVEVTDPAADDVRDGATNLGDITDLDGPRFPDASLDGDGDRIDYFRFTLTEAKEVGLGLRQQDADADLFLEDAQGNVLYSGTVDGTANEAITETLLAGTYYVRVEAQEAGDNEFKLRYGVSAADSDEVARLEQQQGGTNEAPAFGQESYVFELAENADGSTDRISLGTVAASDPEGVALTYSLVGGNASGLFEIDAASGELFYTGSGEDFESATNSFSLTVRASDGSLHADTTVAVNVTNVAEAPAFGAQSYAFTLAENADGSTDRISLGSVAASDPEGATVAYSIVGDNASGLFEIDAASGELFYTGSGEDFESATNSFSLTVRASDGSLHADTTVAVTVSDVAEGDSSQGTVGEESQLDPVPEEATIRVLDTAGADLSDNTSEAPTLTLGQSVKGEISSSGDVDGYAVALEAGVTYIIDLEGAATDAGTLADPLLRWIRDSDGSGIHGTRDDDSGEGLNSRQTFTPDESGTYYFSARSKGDGTGTYTLTVRAEDEPPAFDVQTHAFTLVENTDGSTDRVSLGTVAASDPEGAALTYSIVGGNASGLFEIDAAGGELFYLGSGEDFESGANSFSLTVRASDGSLHADATVEVNVTDVAEAPVFGAQGYAFTLTENADGSTDRVPLGTVAARDPEGAALTYSLVGGSSSGSFEIDAASGELFYTGTGEDYDSGSTEFALTVRASDGSLHSDATVAVNVTEEQQASVSEEETTTEEVAALPSLRVEDAEAYEGPNAVMEFRVVLNRASTGTVTVNYATANGTAEAGKDYFTASGKVTFAAGETEQTVRVMLIDDAIEDSGETFRLVLSDPVGAELGASEATGTIHNTEPPDDYAADSTTTAAVTVGGSLGGNIEAAYDRDWFKVTLETHRMYQIDIEGADTNKGTLRDPYLFGVYDSDGNLIPGTSADNHGQGPYTIAGSDTVHPGSQTWNARLFFYPNSDGDYYIAVNSTSILTGTYQVSVKDYQRNISNDDYVGDTDTTGSVSVGGSSTGSLQDPRDWDWFSVSLDAGKTYRIDVESGGSKILTSNSSTRTVIPCPVWRTTTAEGALAAYCSSRRIPPGTISFRPKPAALSTWVHMKSGPTR